MQNTLDIKNKIIRTIQIKGPSIPVHISKEINQSILFTSAFLSELLSEKKLKITNLRVGSSPIYFLLGQENQLEKYSQYLKSKEKEAFILLKEKKILEDDKQIPAIRVALRAIKDFAIAFKKQEQIYWRYFLTQEKEFDLQKDISQENSQKITDKKNTLSITPKKINEDLKFNKQEINHSENKPKKQIIKKTNKKKSNQKANEKFFNKIKEYLSEKSIEIVGIEGFSKTEITLKLNIQGEEKLMIAYNKKRITEKDITNAYKKAKEIKLKYIILSLGETSKKIDNLIKAIKNLEDIEKIQ
jgi:hypothetical protein